MTLSDRKIIRGITDKSILIEPYHRECLGTNSYDVHLGDKLAIYEDEVLDFKKNNKVKYIDIPEEGFVLQPNELYLGATVEYTECDKTLVPDIDGKSSVGRLGVFIHVTAGRGDAEFKGHWTLEIVCVKPVRIYANVPIGQLTYSKIDGSVYSSYNDKKSAKYANHSPLPMPSKMYENWDSERKSWYPAEEN